MDIRLSKSRKMNRFLAAILIIAVFYSSAEANDQTALPDREALRSWVQEMKKSPRGPFKHIRWFCHDGTVLPPKEYACEEHGGGVQHGEWTDRVKALRTNGYYIANVFADVKPEDFLEKPVHLEILKQMILEQFLINADDGWILAKARYYRGALQAEDEVRGGRDLLIALVGNSEWQASRFTLLREAVRLLPHGRRGAPISEMRQLALNIAAADKDFETLRIKIHVKPQLSDAQQVRDYAESRGDPELYDEYRRLAATIEEVYRPQEIGTEIVSLAKHIRNANLAELLKQDAGLLIDQNEASVRFSAACRLLSALRDGIPKAGRAEHILAFIDTGLVLEAELFRSVNDLLDGLDQTSRRQRLTWLMDCTEGLYGSGLISARQQQALQQSLARITVNAPNLLDYKMALEYAARVPDWADRTLRFHFSDAIAHLAKLEPLTRRYIHDRLHGSLLLFYSAVLDGLMSDANRQLGFRNDLFGQKVASGLYGLNAGLARGVINLPRPQEAPQLFNRNGIYVLPATTEDLPPIAGIVTMGKGNILSHVQLLARNLGIPNVAVDKSLLPQINSREGQRVVLAVSPRGMVQLVDDGPQWDAIFAEEKKSRRVVIRPDLEKLDLSYRGITPLDKLRIADSGRVAGPKAANLGELKHHFPKHVTDGLVIPFGFFRALLDQPLEPGGSSMFSWMQEQYALIRGLQEESRQREEETRRFLQRVRDWILNADPVAEFSDRLRSALEKSFGDDGTYGVFVRSDTNVEDLPGFSGAGLNLTVPNVVGFVNIMEAIRRVWASPFTERAYRWRQACMESPEHVYVSVLLLKSIPADKSGVMVTANVDGGQKGWLTIAVNEGVGGAVSGQSAEELRINLKNGRIKLMAQATEPHKQLLSIEGGIVKMPASGADTVLTQQEIDLLIEFAQTVPQRFPKLLDAQGQPVPADIEFGFYRDKLVLFQIRPFLESARARQSLLLNRLDQELSGKHSLTVELDQIPGE